MQKIHLMTTSATNDGVLSVSDNFIWQELEARGVSGKCFGPEELNFECHSYQHFIQVHNEALETNGLLAVRLTRGMTERSYEAVRFYESLGGKVSDPVETLAHTGSKLLPLLKRKGRIAQVPTYFFTKSSTTFSVIIEKVSLPFVIKPHIGARGVGVALIPSESAFVEYLEAAPDREFIAQQYITDIEAEFRVIVIGGQALGVVKKNRPADADSFLGELDTDEGVDEPVVAELAERAAQVSGGDVYGADIVRVRTGDLYVIENNRCPDFSTFREATQIPVEKHLVDFWERTYLNQS